MANGGYRKIIILCIIVVFGVSVRMTETLLCVKAADKKTPDDLKLYAQSAVLMDGESGRHAVFFNQLPQHLALAE